MENQPTGGLLVGETDKNGEKGIRVIAPEGNIRMGGGEGVLTSDTMKSVELHEFDGKEMTPCEIASELNQEGGGVKIPCVIAKPANTTDSKMAAGDVIKMDTGGKIPKSAIKEGTKVELEHRDTIEKIKNNPNISVEKSAELIARDHLNESNDYYKKLKVMESNLSHGGQINDIELTEMMWLLKNEGSQSFSDPENISVADELVKSGLVDKTGGVYGLTKNGESQLMKTGGRIKNTSNKLLAPNGKTSNLNPKQYEIVRSKEFKKWFGDWENNPSGASKIIDENGEPKVVYHGTGTTITEFKPEYLGQGNDQLGSGFYFTNSIDEAEAYTTNTINRQPKLGGSGNPNVISVFLNIKNPLYETTPDKSTASQIKKILESSPGFEDNLWNFGDWKSEGKSKVTQQAVDAYTGNYDTLLRLINAIGNDFYKGHEKELLEQVNKIYGYDGLKHTFENGKTHFVAWFPTQIKLADGSNTTFDKRKPDIRLHIGGAIPNKTNDTQTSKCKTMEYHEKLTACQKTKLGDKYLGVGTTVKDTKTNLVSDIKSVEHRGFKLLPQSSFDNAPRYEFFVSFEEFLEKYEAGLIEVGGYTHTDPDQKLMHVAIKDLIACNIIKELENGYVEDVVVEAMAKGGIIGEIKANKRGEIKEIRDINGKLLKKVHVGEVVYIRNVDDRNYRNTQNDLLMKFDSAGIHMAYGGIVGVEEMPNYYRVDISSPRKVSTCRTPKWASHAAESVKKGAKVVTCKKYKDWFISSVLVPKDGITEGGAKEIASEIKDKIQGKKMANGGIILESGAVSQKVDNLILFADNTRNIAEMRDAVYATIESRIKRGGKPTIAEISERFNTMLLKTRGQYVREMGNTKDAREAVDLSEKEQEEFKILYAMDFPNWLKEKYGKDISHQVAEYVSSLYGISFANGGHVPEVDYDKARAIQYWRKLKTKQRLHFLVDHTDDYFDKHIAELIGTKEFKDYKKLASSNWNDLPTQVKSSIENHVIMGTYCAGGIMDTGGEVDVDGYTSTNPEIEQYLKDDLDATSKGLLVLIECTEDESEKENLRKRLGESN